MSLNQRHEHPLGSVRYNGSQVIRKKCNQYQRLRLNRNVYDGKHIWQDICKIEETHVNITLRRGTKNCTLCRKHGCNNAAASCNSASCICIKCLFRDLFWLLSASTCIVCYHIQWNLQEILLCACNGMILSWYMYNSIIVVPKICVLITDCLKLLKTIKTCGIACWILTLAFELDRRETLYVYDVIYQIGCSINVVFLN